MRVMQVLPSTRAKAGRPSKLAFYVALFAGTVFTAVGLALLYIVFGGAFMTRFMPTGRPSTYDLIVGALAWTFALTAPAGFGLVGADPMADPARFGPSVQVRVPVVVGSDVLLGDRHAPGDPVDETGEIRVERVAAAHDVGRIVNPLGARSQVEGGIIQGIGHTLSEQRLLDPQTGVVLTQSLDAYRLPTIADVPEIVSELLDKPDEHLTNLGSKGLGEPPIVPTAAAIANAIRDATGADIRSLPISREEMLRALAAARQKEAGGVPATV